MRGGGAAERDKESGLLRGIQPVRRGVGGGWMRGQESVWVRQKENEGTGSGIRRAWEDGDVCEIRGRRDGGLWMQILI